MEVDEQRLQATKKKFNLHMWAHSSSLLTRIFIRVNISANQITFLSCVLGLMSISALHIGYKALSILLYYFYTVLDYSDGWVARYTGTESVFGDRLDHINHTTITILLFIEIMFVSGWFILCSLVIILYLHGMYISSYDVGILRGVYDVVSLVSPVLPLELSLYFGIISNRFELVIASYLVLYGAMLSLTMITKVGAWYRGNSNTSLTGDEGNE